MSSKQSHIHELIEKIDQTYWGPEERAMIDEALALSQEIGDEELEYKVRLRLTASGSRTGDNDAMLSSFAWCLAKHDADPARFPTEPGNGMADLMWQFKWMIGALDSSPIFSLAQCQAMLDDMEAHYRSENLGMSGVITSRFQHAWETGQIGEAKKLRTVLESTPRDEHSHCDACGRSELAGFAAEVGDEAVALKLVDEIIEGGFSCGEEPEHALSRTLVAKLRAGRTDDALDAHIRSYRLARHNPDNISIVADNMIFCAITGNEARGLAMVERHISWLSHDALNVEGQLNLLTAIAVVLESVVRAGHGDQMVRRADSDDLVRFFGTREDPWTALELAKSSWQAAMGLAQKFDARNENTYVSTRTQATMNLLNEHYDVPLRTEVFIPPMPTALEPSTPTEWLELAEFHIFAGDIREAIEAAERVIEGGDAIQRSRALQITISAALHAEGMEEDDPSDKTAVEAAGLIPARVAALREEGREAQARLEERLGLALYGRGADGDLAQLEAELIQLDGTAGPELADVEVTIASLLMQRAETENEDASRVLDLLNRAVTHAQPTPQLQASALRRLSFAHVSIGDLDSALLPVDKALPLPIPQGFRASLLVHRAKILGGLSRYDEGAVNADEATALYASHRMAHEAVNSALLAGALLDDAERYDDEVTRLRYAQREIEQAERPSLGIRFRLGKALTRSGAPHEGVELLWEVLQEEEAAEAEPGDRADTAFELARAFEAAEKYGNAAGMFEKAADLFEESEQPLTAAEALRRQGNLFRRFEMKDEALEALNRAWEMVQGNDSPRSEVLVLEALALGKGEAEDESAVDDIDRCVGIVASDPEGPFPWKIADLTDTKARILMDLEKFDDAVATFLEAAQGYSSSDDHSGSIGARHLAAQILAGPLARGADAVLIWQAALADADRTLAEDDTDESVGGIRASILVKLAETLDSLGRPAEAAQIRSLTS